MDADIINASVDEPVTNVAAVRITKWRATVVGVLVLVIISAWIALHVGWLRTDQPWPVATGWQSIDTAMRAPVTDVIATTDGPLRLLWLGHAGFLLEWSGTRLYLDPNTSATCTIAPRVIEAVPDARQLPAADAVLISHAHYDHFDLPTIEQMPVPGTIIVPRGSAQWLGTRKSIATSLEPWQSMSVGNLVVTAVPAAHNGNRFHPLASSTPALGYVIRNDAEAIYFAGDTGARNDFEAIRDRLHPDIAILPIGAFRPSFPMKRYHLSPSDAVDVARRLDVRLVVPCHFGTFVLSLDDANEALPRFARAAREQGVTWVMPELMPLEATR